MHIHSTPLPSHNYPFILLWAKFSVFANSFHNVKGPAWKMSQTIVSPCHLPQRLAASSQHGGTVLQGTCCLAPLVSTFRQAGWHWHRLQRTSHSNLLCSLKRKILKGSLTIGKTSIKSILTSSPRKDNFLACAASI